MQQKRDNEIVIPFQPFSKRGPPRITCEYCCKVISQEVFFPSRFGPKVVLLLWILVLRLYLKTCSFRDARGDDQNSTELLSLFSKIILPLQWPIASNLSYVLELGEIQGIDYCIQNVWNHEILSTI